MSLKRNFIPDFYKQRKKLCGGGPSSPESLPDVKVALDRLHSLFPVDKFEHRVPAIVMKHQLYSLVDNKTHVDKQLNELRNKGDIRFFHLGEDVEDVGIVYAEEYRKHVKKLNEENPVVSKFLNSVLPASNDVSLTKEIMETFTIKEKDVTELFRAGVLTVRDVGSWWISIPGAGEFMKTYIRGRKAILQMIRRTKYAEILQQDLEKRQLPKLAKLGMAYHLHDIKGAELVDSITTTSGQLLRAKEY